MTYPNSTVYTSAYSNRTVPTHGARLERTNNIIGDRVLVKLAGTKDHYVGWMKISDAELSHYTSRWSYENYKWMVDI